MTRNHSAIIAKEIGIQESQVVKTLDLLDGGSTIPFISRYRKEVTNNLDEVQITSVRDRASQLRELDKRKEAILKSVEEQGKLTDELKHKFEEAQTMGILEDLYLPYKPKRKTKASIAKEKGLEPLATKLYLQVKVDVDSEAESFIDAEKDLPTTKEVLQGARDIIAEWINENAEVREAMRNMFLKNAYIKSKVLSGKEEEGQKYQDYFDWEEPLARVPSHRLLAMFRGEQELFLILNLIPDEEEALLLLERQLIRSNFASSDQVRLAYKECFKRLLGPAMQTEARMDAKKRADAEAIRVFTDNLRQLLMDSPLGQKNVLALDPGFRTGCKMVVLNKQGDLLNNENIYPHIGQRERYDAEAKLQNKVEQYQIEAIAIGNGTASRETETFVQNIKFKRPVQIIVVNESGASVYSASSVAREEFPEYDVTVRGAVSIGRRLMDPLAELVKLDPKVIGVGQYQHDVDQIALQKSLEDVVESCVNGVGVEVNTASKQLLTYVSGLGPVLAQNIVDYRKENGPFKSRKELLKVPRMGDKAFEQCAGFLRIRDGIHPLDRSAVHPETYSIVESMAKDLNVNVDQLMSSADLRKQLDLKRYISDKVGLPTLQDILKELEKPGRDPRAKFESFQFAEGVTEVKHLYPGMVLPGLVTNITAFGCFVDVGVHQDGLVHLSELANKFIKDPNEVVKLRQKVMVKVLDVDIERKRVALSMKQV